MAAFTMLEQVMLDLSNLLYLEAFFTFSFLPWILLVKDFKDAGVFGSVRNHRIMRRSR
jgi:hypothetical protein